jgi:hypothetical protein
MVRSLVTNLENFQDELLVVLDDMKDLVGQIDDVSNKLDKQFGKKWRSEDILRSHSLTKVDILPTAIGIYLCFDVFFWVVQCCPCSFFTIHAPFDRCRSPLGLYILTMLHFSSVT